jgi:protein-disulfide isomerase
MSHRSWSRHIRRRSALLVVFITVAALVLPRALLATTSDLPSVVATVQEQPISAEELTNAARSELLRLEMERYNVMKQKLEELIAARLMQLEAHQRGVSLQQLEQEEIIAKTAPVTTEQVKAFYEANKNRIRQPLEQVEPRIEAYLQQQERLKQQQTFLRDLRQRYPVTIALAAPTVNVTADDDPFVGPTDAPVTIIEFSDFQCPYCRRVQPILKQVLKDYQGTVKLVFRDFPLRNIHPQAQKAAEAAQCAAEQQQFWPYHDKLFATPQLEEQALKQYAQELGLDMQRFEPCISSGKYAQEVERDLQDGINAGVSATPSFFINGQPLSGAAPYERFKELVDSALEQAKSAKRTNQ